MLPLSICPGQALGQPLKLHADSQSLERYRNLHPPRSACRLNELPVARTGEDFYAITGANHRLQARQDGSRPSTALGYGFRVERLVVRLNRVQGRDEAVLRGEDEPGDAARFGVCTRLREQGRGVQVTGGCCGVELLSGTGDEEN